MVAQNLIIADPSEDFRNALAHELEGLFQISLCQDGYETLAALDSSVQQILVIDPTLSGIDGISLLQHAAKQASLPVTLVASRFLSDYMLGALHQLGVAYVMNKPCDLHCFRARIIDLAQQLSPVLPGRDTKSEISDLLLKLGLRPKLAGYGYLAEGILSLAEQPGQSIMKELYPALATAHGTTITAVERSMRTAINGGWLRMDKTIWQQFFPLDSKDSIPRPTNADFLARLAAYVADSCATR